MICVYLWVHTFMEGRGYFMSRFSCTSLYAGCWVFSLTEPSFWLNSFQLLILLLLLLLFLVHNMLGACRHTHFAACMWTLKDSFPKLVLFLHRGFQEENSDCLACRPSSFTCWAIIPASKCFLQFYFIEVINANCMLRHLSFWSGVCLRDWWGGC